MDPVPDGLVKMMAGSMCLALASLLLADSRSVALRAMVLG